MKRRQLIGLTTVAVILSPTVAYAHRGPLPAGALVGLLGLTLVVAWLARYLVLKHLVGVRSAWLPWSLACVAALEALCAVAGPVVGASALLPWVLVSGIGHFRLLGGESRLFGPRVPVVNRALITFWLVVILPLIWLPLAILSALLFL